ncbi:MAG: hypothetical protein PHG06_22825, partial [Parabacteroides sp.]|nr:hypothetical protein [Parabacteroides sp.]
MNNIEQDTKMSNVRFGSPIGLLAVFIIGFALYFILGAIQGNGAVIYDYDAVLDNIKNGSGLFYWFFMNFSEPNFLGGLFTSIFLLLGGAVSWLLCIKGSKFAGFEICYGSARVWPWVFASQILT